MELSNRRFVKWWNGGVGGVVESLNSSIGGMMEFVELMEWSNRRIVELSKRRIVEFSICGMADW